MHFSFQDLHLYYEIHGSGTAILMLHGFSPDHRLMKGCMEPIFEPNAAYKRVYVDLPGMGRSGSADWITSSDDMLDILAAFIDHVLPEENFLVAGESYGGYLSRGLLHRMAHRIDGVLFICPAILPAESKRNVPKHAVLVKDEALLARLTPEEAADFNAIAVHQNERHYQRYVDEIICGTKLADWRFLTAFRAKGYSFSFEVDPLPQPYLKPALFLMGRQDASVGYKDTWPLLDHFPRATFAVLDLAGHNLQLDQPELFSHLVIDWLWRVRMESPA